MITHCPQCQKPLNVTPAQVGKSLTCPHCQAVFKSHALSQAEIAGNQVAALPWRWILGAIGIGIGVMLVIQTRQSAPPPGPSAEERKQAMTNAIPRLAEREASRRVVGFRRVVETEIKAESESISGWQAFVTAEYVTDTGGVARTNLTIYFAQSMGTFAVDDLR